VTLDPYALKRRADEILDAMPEDDRPIEDRIADAVERARREIARDVPEPEVTR
jgi:hypothetical protein